MAFSVQSALMMLAMVVVPQSVWAVLLFRMTAAYMSINAKSRRTSTSERRHSSGLLRSALAMQSARYEAMPPFAMVVGDVLMVAMKPLWSGVLMPSRYEQLPVSVACMLVKIRSTTSLE